MRVLYRELFLKDLHKLKGTSVYKRIRSLVFEVLPKANSLSDIPAHIKPLRKAKNKFRIRIGDYRIGIKVNGDTVEVMRVKHRKEFYRFFPQQR